MPKTPTQFLLFGGLNYYPRGGAKDFAGHISAPSLDNAREQALRIFQTPLPPEYDGQEPEYRTCQWYQIVDARTMVVLENGEGLGEDGHSNPYSYERVHTLRTDDTP